MKTVCAGCQVLLKGQESDTEVSHGLCADCIRRLYPGYAEDILQDLKEDAVIKNEME